ncbi:hypothetical protein FQA39_LY19229 [Lamprigera yunnana]|nr:hypothetical protein FQA39_LY19229 [Lamprigera yunnana]
MGGQTALNCALDLWHNGVLDKYKVELIGATPEAIDKAEDRLKFKDAMTKIGLGSARSGIAHSMDEAWAVQKEMGFPTVIRPSFTLGGTGGGIAYNPEEFEIICKRGLEASPTNELLIEESLLGWKEYEMEVIEEIVKIELDLDKHFEAHADNALSLLDATSLRMLKQKGFSDRRLAKLLHTSDQAVREARKALGVRPVYKRVDTCAAEFASNTAYMYSTYDEECEAAPTDKKKIMVLGGGPNRIGQGIEFDYCCVHAAMAMREDGYETIMVNCNPETVSTDYDTSDRLYFEPLTLEDVLEIVDVEKPAGVIVQYGGQTPLKLALGWKKEALPSSAPRPT